MSDLADAFRDLREHNRTQRAKRRASGTVAIEALADHGYTVDRITEHQFRVGGELDLYPTNGRWHHIPSGKRGRYRRALEIAERFLEADDA